MFPEPSIQPLPSSKVNVGAAPSLSVRRKLGCVTVLENSCTTDSCRDFFFFFFDCLSCSTSADEALLGGILVRNKHSAFSVYLDFACDFPVLSSFFLFLFSSLRLSFKELVDSVQPLFTWRSVWSSYPSKTLPISFCFFVFLLDGDTLLKTALSLSSSFSSLCLFCGRATSTLNFRPLRIDPLSFFLILSASIAGSVT